MVDQYPFPQNMTRYQPEPNTGCWLWEGPINQDGYGRPQINGRKVLAHKYVFEHVVGAIPEGYEIDHTCFVRSCVNPKHLELVTQGENKRRAAMRRTTCPSGHPYDRVRPDGVRYCQRCNYAKTLRWRNA
jgi:hypothetical protein